MARFRDIKTLQKFAAIHASIHNYSHGELLVKEGSIRFLLIRDTPSEEVYVLNMFRMRGSRL